MAYHFLQQGMAVSCDTADELRALLPPAANLILNNPKSRARKLGKRGRKRKAKSPAMAELWLAARAYAAKKRISPRVAYQLICKQPRKMTIARSMAGLAPK